MNPRYIKVKYFNIFILFIKRYMLYDDCLEYFIDKLINFFELKKVYVLLLLSQQNLQFFVLSFKKKIKNFV